MPLAADALMARATDADPPWIELLPDGVAAITCGRPTGSRPKLFVGT